MWPAERHRYFDVAKFEPCCSFSRVKTEDSLDEFSTGGWARR